MDQLVTILLAIDKTQTVSPMVVNFGPGLGGLN